MWVVYVVVYYISVLFISMMIILNFFLIPKNKTFVDTLVCIYSSYYLINFGTVLYCIVFIIIIIMWETERTVQNLNI